MSGTYEKRVLRVLDYIHDHPAGDLSLDALADVAAMSRFHWHRVFRGITGETVAEAVRRIRMYRAAHWLLQTDWSIDHIAERVGYPNPKSFTRAFRDSFGLTPSSFRERGEPRFYTQTNRHGDKSMYHVEISDQPDRRLAAMQHHGAYPEIGRTFEKLAATITARDLWPQAGPMVGVYYDDPSAVAESDLKSHAGFTISNTADVGEPLEEVRLSGGKMAVLHFKGHYAGLPAAYDYLFAKWLPESGEEAADAPSFEVYLNSPMSVSPDELLTEICLPLK